MGWDLRSTVSGLRICAFVFGCVPLFSSVATISGEYLISKLSHRGFGP